MKDETRRTYQKLKNDLERMVPEADPEYPEEDFMMEPEQEEDERSQFGQKAKEFFNNFLVTVLCVFIALIWWFDWNFSALSDNTSDWVTGLLGNESLEIPGSPEIAPIPGLPDLPDEVRAKIEGELSDGQNDLGMNMTEYVAAVQEAGYRERYSMPELSAFYQADIEIPYLDQLMKRDSLICSHFQP